LDISQAMLDVALEREVEGDVCLGDLGQGLPLRSGTFDGAVSISAIQWLCNADTRSADPRKRIKRFFDSLYRCLTRGARAVLQMYPENADQAQMLTAAAMKAGFSGGLVVDYPHSTRAKKYFLVLMVGSSSRAPQPKGLDGGEPEDEGMPVSGRRHGGKRREVQSAAGTSARHPDAKGRSWIFKKKDNMRSKGYTNVPADSKFTGRKRKSRF
jgi:18S rRNA (guanine1575-N7)-methyltransferase